jgi:uncharacterized membrane protein YfcA
LEVIFSIGFGAVVGLALGLTGGGGSIFAVPLLIYGLGLSPTQAVPISLVGVASIALIGAVQSIRDRLVVWQPTIMFAAGGVVGAPIGVLISRALESRWIVVGFALLALTVGVTMWRMARTNPANASVVRARTYGGDEGPVCAFAPDGQLRFSAPCAFVLMAIGLFTGFLSGLFGVGGGFLIVPALVLVTRMGINRAVATSLMIISAIGFAGAASALWSGGVIWFVLMPFLVGGATGMIGGRFLAKRLAGPSLQSGFAILVVLVGMAMLLDGIFGK